MFSSRRRLRPREAQLSPSFANRRPGNVHSADDWEELLFPEIDRQQKADTEVVFRADAAFAKPEIYEALEERGVKYAIRIPANDGLERDIAELLTRPVGRPSQKTASGQNAPKSRNLEDQQWVARDTMTGSRE